MPWLAPLAISLAAGTLLALPSWSDLFVGAPYLGIVPWIYLYGVRERRPPWLVFLAGVAVFWISYHRFLFGYNSWVPFVVGAIFVPVYLVFPLTLRGLRRLDLPWTAVVPVAWVATEWAVAKLSVAGVATVLLGYTQARVLSLIQIADLGGVYLVSFLIALVNGAVADVGVLVSGAVRDGVPWKRRAFAVPAAALLFVLLANVYGLWRLRTLATEPGPRVGVVQPATPHTSTNLYGAYGPAFFMTAQAWAEPGDVDLIVWPENTIQGSLDRFAIFTPDLSWLARRSGAALLVGAYGRHPRNPSAPTNSAFLVGAEGRTAGRYDKIRLMPWSEFVPFGRLLGLIDRDLPKYYARLIEEVIGFAPAGKPESRGDEVTVFRHGGLPPFSALICFETVDPVLAREAAAGGARFLVNPTSEGQIGAALQLQMLRISALRAVETRLPVVRAGNDGISAFVGPRGDLQALLRGMHTGAYVLEPGIATERLQLARVTTPYVRYGDVFALANVLALLGGLAWTVARP